MRTSSVGLGACSLMLALSLTGCDSVDVKEDSGDVEFAVEGSINTDFGTEDRHFVGAVKFSRTGIANRLDVDLEVTGKRGEREERAGASFRFAYASNSGQLPPGPYSVVPDDVVSSIGEGYYESRSGSSGMSRYAFSGRTLRLDVEESEPGRLSTRFSFELEQTEGRRMVDGEWVVAELAGPVRVYGSFDLPVEGLEFVPSG